MLILKSLEFFNVKMRRQTETSGALTPGWLVSPAIRQFQHLAFFMPSPSWSLTLTVTLRTLSTRLKRKHWSQSTTASGRFI